MIPLSLEQQSKLYDDVVANTNNIPSPASSMMCDNYQHTAVLSRQPINEEFSLFFGQRATATSPE